LPEDRLSGPNRQLKQQLIDRVEVPQDILVRYAKFGVEELQKLYSELDELISSGDDSLFWSGLGSYPKALSIMEIVWGRIEFDKHGVRSARQFAHFANKLIRSDSLREFLEIVANGDDADESIDLGFNFLKGAEFSFIDPLNLVQDMVLSLTENQLGIDYSKFLGDLTSWGLPGHSKALEEIGVPTPIIRKLVDRIEVNDFDVAVADVRRIASSQEILSGVERDILKLTLGGF